MRRLVPILIIAALAAAFAAWIAASPGAATLEFRGWVFETTAGAALFILLTLGVLMAVLWRSIGWLMNLPERLRDSAARSRQTRGYDALEKALIASASGEGGEARKQAQSAGRLLDRPAISRILTARAAEADGLIGEAESQYRLLLEAPGTEVVGRRGLAAAAFERGDLASASEHARAAFEARPGSRWAFETLFEAQVRQAKWNDAAATLKTGEAESHVPPDNAQRRRAVLLTAQAREAETQGQMERAGRLSETAARLSPGFAPAVALASRLLLEGGHPRKASRLIEDSWRAAPHPALAIAWRDLKPDEPNLDRAERLEKLAALNPDHRESRIQRAEAALLRDDMVKARDELKPLIDRNAPSARLCGLMAQIEHKSGNIDEARDWIDRAATAPGEADWSDLDPDGPAFDYRDEDWMRMVFSYGDAAKLIHPRHERYEREIQLAPPLAALPAPEPEKPEPAVEPDYASAAVIAPPEETPEPESGPENTEPAPKPRNPRAAKPKDKDRAPEASPSPPPPDDPGPDGETYDEAGEDALTRSRKFS